MRKTVLWSLFFPLILGAIGGFAGFYLAKSADSTEKPQMTAAAGISAAEQKAFEDRVRTYLLGNPGILADMSGRLQEQYKQQAAEQAQRLIGANAEALFNDASDPVSNPKGTKVLVEFFDYNCPYCKKSADPLKKFLSTHQDVRVIYKELPVLGPDSKAVAKVALAVHALHPDLYPKFHLALLDNQNRVNEAAALDMAADMGASRSDLEKAMKAPEIDKAIEKNLALANSLGISGTPTFVTRNAIQPGAISLTTLTELINRKPTVSPRTSPPNTGG